jgi:hypothetical protein
MTVEVTIGLPDCLWLTIGASGLRKRPEKYLDASFLIPILGTQSSSNPIGAHEPDITHFLLGKTNRDRTPPVLV